MMSSVEMGRKETTDEAKGQKGVKKPVETPRKSTTKSQPSEGVIVTGVEQGRREKRRRGGVEQTGD